MAPALLLPVLKTHPDHFWEKAFDNYTNKKKNTKKKHNIQRDFSMYSHK
jgi:hypothetical protein